MNIVIQHILFFAVGFFQDILITFYYQAIAKQFPMRAAVLSVSVTLVNLIILYEILAGLETQVFSIILAYALGNGTGTYVVVKRNINALH
jgi:hypothetical protein